MGGSAERLPEDFGTLLAGCSGGEVAARLTAGSADASNPTVASSNSGDEVEATTDITLSGWGWEEEDALEAGAGVSSLGEERELTTVSGGMRPSSSGTMTSRKEAGWPLC